MSDPRRGKAASSMNKGQSTSRGGIEPTRRFVRLERSTYAEDIANAQTSGSSFLAESNAAIKRSRANSMALKMDLKGKEVAAEIQRGNAAKFEQRIEAAYIGSPKVKSDLMRTHATSSAQSPYLSGTPSFTTGENSQLTYMAQNLRRGIDQTATIHYTQRAAPNPHNSREQELLLAGGERREERVGILHVKPMPGTDKVMPLFVDRTGKKPKLFLGAGAVRRFKELSQE